MSSPPQVDTWTEKTLRSYLETNTSKSALPEKNIHNNPNPFNPAPPSVGITGVLPNENNNNPIEPPLATLPIQDTSTSSKSINPCVQLLLNLIKLIFFALVLLSPLLLEYLPLPFSLPNWLKTPSSDNVSNGKFLSIHLWLPLLTLVVLGLPFANTFVRILIWSLGASSPIGRPKDKQPSLVRSRSRHFLTVSQKYVALFAYISALALCLNAMDLEQLFLMSTSNDQSERNTGNIHVTLNKILFALVLGTLLFAYKNYAVISMAMAFNYANYIVRIRDSLFADRMLVILEDAARASYRMRKKLTANFQNRHDSSRLISIFESPRRVLVTAGGWLKPLGTLSKDHHTETSTPSSSIPVSPTISLSEPQGVTQIMEPTFNPLEMQEDLVDFNRLAERILTTFEGSGLGALNRSSTISANNRYISSSVNSGSVPSTYPLTLPQATMTGFDGINKPMNNTTAPNPVTPIEKSKNDSYHYSEIRRHAIYRAHKISTWLSKDPISLEDLKICLQGSCSTVDLDRFCSAMLLAQRGAGGSTDPRSVSPSTQSKKGSFTSLPKRALADFIERSYLEVISVANSLSSMEAAVSNLNLCCSIICLILLLVFLALLFGDFLAALTSVSSLIFGAAFMFGSSAKNIFESIIFLFVVHPFDIGDRVFVSLLGGTGPAPPISMPAGGALFTNASPGSGALENLVVLQMHLMTTVFERWDGARIYIPNYVLATKPIVNVRRSGALFDRHYLQIAFDTPSSSIATFRSRIANFVAQERNDYTSQFLVNIELIENVNRMHLVVLVQHRSNWQDLEAQLTRRTKLLLFLKDTMQELKITYIPPIQKVELFPTPSGLASDSCPNSSIGEIVNSGNSLGNNFTGATI